MFTPSPCETFRALAFRTFEHLGRARAVAHQPLEETLTDINILDLKIKHPTEIHSRTFTRHQEGKNGADWEWWLTNSSKSVWLGLRVQAKVLNLATDSFTHLHYKSGKAKIYQLAKLKREAKKEGLVPLYCCYSHEEPTKHESHGSCLSYAHAPESYGCSITSLASVEALQKAGEKCDRASVLQHALPWHCLVCCSGCGGDDLPSRAWSLLQSAFSIREKRLTRRENVQVPSGIPIGPRARPPEYVSTILHGRTPDTVPKHVSGVLVIQGSENN